MHRALAQFNTPFQRILVDGDVWKPWTDPLTKETVEGITIINGDAVSLPIAAASILAKEAHDRWVKEMVAARPDLHEHYGFGTNMGYGTAAHMNGLKQWGPDILHRRSFAPVKAVTNLFSS
jgi:ribonuclease HII